jgi:hypothetical protein
MTVKFNLESGAFGDLFLEFLDHGVPELDYPFAIPAIQMVVVLLRFGGFIKSIPARFEALLDHARIEKDRKVTVDRIAGDFKAFFLEPADKPVHVKVTPLTADPTQELQTLPGHAEIFLFKKIAEEVLLSLRHEGPCPARDRPRSFRGQGFIRYNPAGTASTKKHLCFLWISNGDYSD